jgi:hypothetical protein
MPMPYQFQALRLKRMYSGVHVAIIPTRILFFDYPRISVLGQGSSSPLKALVTMLPTFEACCFLPWPVDPASFSNLNDDRMIIAPTRFPYIVNIPLGRETTNHCTL